jgi:hypothetical protein
VQDLNVKGTASVALELDEKISMSSSANHSHHLSLYHFSIRYEWSIPSA